MLCCLLVELLVVCWVCRVGYAAGFYVGGWVLCKSVVLLGGALELFFSSASGLWCVLVSGSNWSYKAVGLWSWLVSGVGWSLELVSGTGLLSYAL